jgi:hypothetical protein
LWADAAAGRPIGRACLWDGKRHNRGGSRAGGWRRGRAAAPPPRRLAATRPPAAAAAAARPQHRPSSAFNPAHWTTNTGAPVWNNNNSLTVGARGPILLEDYQLVEKIAQFDRERIPERVVHARGASAKGFFEARGRGRPRARGAPSARGPGGGGVFEGTAPPSRLWECDAPRGPPSQLPTALSPQPPTPR